MGRRARLTTVTMEGTAYEERRSTRWDGKHDLAWPTIGSVILIDPDEGSRQALRTTVEGMRLSARTYADAESFLREFDPEAPVCVVTEIRLRGLSGLELQEMFLQQRRPTPFIFASMHGTTQLVVRAMRNGAVAFLDKPPHDDELWLYVREAFKREEEARRRTTRLHELEVAFAELTHQERNVLEFIEAGMTNKQIATALDVSVRTVESRRRQLFRKTGAENLPQLIRRHYEYLRGARRDGQHSTPPPTGR